MASKKILIHGSINTANFGDVLFAELFYNYIKNNNIGQPHFLSTPHLGISDYVRDYISYHEKFRLKDLKEASLIVFMSGGYLGDAKKTFRGSLTRWAKYAFVYYYARLLRIPMAVCGVGGGPLYHWFNRRSFSSLLKYARYATVRDEQTRDYFEKLGVHNKILTTTDSALVITGKSYHSLNSNVKEELHGAIGNKKKIFVHVPHVIRVIDAYRKYLIPGMNQFIEKHPDFGVVFITDEQHGVPLDLVKLVETDSKYVYHYTTPDQLCAFLDYADLVITAKLHVGIVSSALGKSVLSFPLHVHKTWRFYSQIGETERTIPLEKMTIEVVVSQIEKFYSTPIVISKELRNRAKQNFTIIQNCFEV